MLSRRTVLSSALSVSALPLMSAAALAQAPTDPTRLSVAEASALIRARRLSPVELCQAYLARIERINPRINAFITVTAELALEQARERESELTRGQWRGPRHGIPIGLKDNIDTAGIRTTAAATLFADRVPDTDAEVWRRLQAAGAVLLGKLNMHEFAYGGTNAISHFGPVRNPWDLTRIPGGSSGGSGAAVAARLCAAALGTDTLASVRMPAAYCGVVGVKPSNGMTPLRGIIPVSESLDCVGPLCREVSDCALMLQAMAGHDPLDPVSLDRPAPDFSDALEQPMRGYRLGLPTGGYWDNLDEQVASATRAAVDRLVDMGAELRELDLPPAPDFIALLAEAYAWHRPWLESEANRSTYDPVTLERLLAAAEVTMPQYYEGRRQLALARKAIDSVFTEVDLLLTPTTPALPETIDQAQNPAAADGAEDSARNLFMCNLYGIPATSVPCGFSPDGLPIGLQIIGPRWGELDMLALAQAWQQSSGLSQVALELEI